MRNRGTHNKSSRGISYRQQALLLIALLFPVVAAAQIPGTDTLFLTWEEVAVRVAANPDLLRQRVEVERARAERLRIGGFFPSLPELEYSTTTDSPFHGAGEGGWELGLSQEIEIGGQYFLRRAIADAGIAEAEFQTQAVELELRVEARRAFARLVSAESRIQLLDTLTGFARRLDTLAVRLLEVQEIAEIDRNLVHIESTGAEIELVTAQGELGEARAELASLLGIKSSTVLVARANDDLQSPSVALDSATRVIAALEAGDTGLLARRPDWQALDRAAERVQHERNLASRMWIPNVRVGVSVESETSVIDRDALVGGSEVIREGFGEIRDQDKLLGLHIGIGVPLPFGGLYDLGQGERAVVETELMVVNAERARIIARIRTDLARSAARLRSAASAVLLYTKEITPLVRRNLELLERGYAAGELSATEVVTQRDRLVRSAEAMIEAQQKYAEALADFKRAIGE
jgi:outer membrane protein TolC